jgi:conjugative transfer region protein TrbK
MTYPQGLRAAAILVLAAVAAAALIAARAPSSAHPVIRHAVSVALTDPLTLALTRCTAIGPRDLDEPACEAAWAENRRRFFGAPPAAAAGPSHSEGAAR